MPRSRHHLDHGSAVRAATMMEAGHSQRSVASQIGCSRTAIQNLWNRYQETGSVSRRRGSGRVRATTAQEDRYVRLCARRDRNVTARVLQNQLRRATGTIISDQTIRNRLHEDEQHSRRPVLRTKLTGRHRANRLRFARQHAEWGTEEWCKVLFTDECKVKFFSDDKRVRVWRRKGERFSDPCIHERDRYGGPNVMVWGGISLRGKTDLVFLNEGTVTSLSYIERIVRPYVIPFAQQAVDGFILIQDNARPHTARATLSVLEEANIQVMAWPANSPDLNPIEHIWDQLKRRVRAAEEDVHNQQQLIELLKRCWEDIPEENIRHVIRTMPSRLRECISKRGGHTRY